MSPTDIAWLAGIIEGEGCINIERKRGRASASILLRLAMTDRDVVERAASILGSEVREAKPAKSHYKRVYTTCIFGGDAAAWIADLWDYFGGRRRAKGIDALTAYCNGKARTRNDGLCKRGHQILEAGTTYVDKRTGQQWCKKCKLLLMKARYGKGKMPRTERNAA